MLKTNNVRVTFRLRPMNNEEQKEERYGCVKVNQDKARVSVRNEGATKHFNFDRVFDDKSPQTSVYKESVAALVSDFLSGRNCCILAYGEQGSGKSFTMNGPSTKEEEDVDNDDDMSSIGSSGVSRYKGDGGNRDVAATQLPGQVITAKGRHKAFSSGTYAPAAVEVGPLFELDENAGITHRVVQDVFERIRRIRKTLNALNKKEEPSIRFSFLEVANEHVIDLLGQAVDDVGGDQELAVDQIVEKMCNKESEVIDYFQTGMSNRAERLERKHSHSSRSHSVVVLKLERYSRSRGKRTTSSLFLVDLANSSLVHRPPSDADSLLINESKAVRRSLGALRKCLRALALNDRSSSPPYAESALTRLLQVALGRAAGVSVIVTANPLSRHVNETLSAIRFGTYVSGQRMESKDDSSRDTTSGVGRRRGSSFTPGSRSPVTEKSIESEKTPQISGGSKSGIHDFKENLLGKSTENNACSNVVLMDAHNEGIGFSAIPGFEVPLISETVEEADLVGQAIEGLRRNNPLPKENLEGHRQRKLSEGGSVPLSSCHVSETVASTFQYVNQTFDGMTDTGSGTNIRPSYTEHDDTGELLNNFKGNMVSRNDDHDTDKDLAQLSTLLVSASDKMKTALDVTDEELHATGQKSITEEEMKRELNAVTRELNITKCDGHLSLLAAQKEAEELPSASISDHGLPENGQQSKKKWSSLNAHLEKHSDPGSMGNGRPMDNNIDKKTEVVSTGQFQKMGILTGPDHDQRSRTTDEIEIDRLLEEMEALKQENERLARESVDRDEDLAKAEIEILELRSKIAAAASVTDIAKTSDSSKPRRTSTTSVTTEMSESAMTSMIGRNFDVDIIKGENDPWEEPAEEIDQDPIKVCLRLRPMTKLERNRRSRSCIEAHEGDGQFTVDSPLDGEYDFSFDHVFNVDSSQQDVYETVGSSLVDSLLQGINCSVLAYGLSGSGKTHTLTGKLPELADDRGEGSSDEDSISTTATPREEDAGILPRMINDLFHGMKEYPEYIEFRLSCTYVAIFLEKIFDLLDPKLDKTLLVTDMTSGIALEGAVEAFCFNEDDIIQLIRRGTACRKLIGNDLSMDPNRSHAIFMLHIEQRHIRSGAVRRSYLQLAELAGFEVASKAKVQSVQETKIIHKSFSALGNVIKCLTEGHTYVPYREAKLTSILKDAFGGNCRTTFFITASPSSYNITETINSIRLGQRVRRVTNKPRMNKDAGIEDYRKWLLQTEIKFGELSSLVQEFAKDLVQESKRDGTFKQSVSISMWRKIQAIADEEESVHNPCRKALVMGEDERQLQNLPKWRALSIELAKRMPSDKLVEVIRAHDRAESLLTDIQSESVVLRRQNELLVQEKRKREEELCRAQTENREKELKHSELEHKLIVVENRCREAICFLRYMRTLCWKLRKDTDKDRPITVPEITSTIAGAPDLSGLVDLDSLMIDAGLIESDEVNLDTVEGEFFDYLEDAGLIISGAAIEEDDVEVDELAGLEDGIDDGGSNRWLRRAATARPHRTGGFDDQSIASRSTLGGGASQSGDPSVFGLAMPWQNKKDETIQEKYEPHASNTRYTRREQELRRDLKNLANKCVDLQVSLNEQKLLMDSMCNRVGDLQRKKLAQEAIALAKERDRLMHNAKAAAWKLRELHVVNRLLSKQNAETKQQVSLLEEGFQRLQERFRSTVQDGLDADSEFRERAKNLQSIVDSLTGSMDDKVEDEHNLLNTQVHLPIRGKIKPKIVGAKLVDPSTSDSQVRSLILNFKGKRPKKTPVASVHHCGKWHRRTRKTGTALVGVHRQMLLRAHELGTTLTLPNWLEDDEGENDSSVSVESLSESSFIS